MALQTSGTITLSQIRNEFGGAGALWLSQYYRGGGRVPNSPKNYSISTSGRIAHSMFYGASAQMSPEELGAEAARGMSSFSRRGNSEWKTYRSAQPYSGDNWNNENWPIHKSSPGEYNFTWLFDNMGWAATEDQCMVMVITSSIRQIAQLTISNITKYNGQGVGFTHLFHSLNQPGSRNFCFSLYRVYCDRREISSIVTYCNQWGGDNGSASASVHILPGGNWSIVNYKFNPFTNARMLYHGDVVFTAGTVRLDGWKNGSLSTPDSHSNGSHWHGSAVVAAAYGSYTRSWAVADTNLTPKYGDTNAAYAFVRLRNIPAGQNVTQYDNLSPSLRVLSGQYLSLGPGAETGEGYAYNYQTFSVAIDNTDGDVAVEAPIVVGYSISDPSIILHISNGVIYFIISPEAMPTTDPFTATVGFNASITLSSAGGRQVSAGISGTIYASTSYYTIQTG